MLEDAALDAVPIVVLSLSVYHLAKGSCHDVEGVPFPVLDGPLDDDVLVLLVEDDLTPLSEVL